jgi:hypothetical protein
MFPDRGLLFNTTFYGLYQGIYGERLKDNRQHPYQVLCLFCETTSYPVIITTEIVDKAGFLIHLKNPTTGKAFQLLVGFTA